MLIDWSTIFFQLVNFAILVWLLKRLLYKPILRNMDKREQRIADRLEKAREREKEASREQEHFRRKTEELEQKRGELIKEAEEEAEKQREQLVHQAREEAEQLRRSWKEALQREKETFLRDLSRRAGESVFKTMERVLVEMSDTSVQEQMVAVFGSRLQSLETEPLERMRESLADGDSLSVRSAFELSEKSRKAIAKACKDSLGTSPATFETDEDMIAGVALEAGGREITWSVKDYLKQMQREFEKDIEQHDGTVPEAEGNNEQAPAPEEDAFPTTTEQAP